MFRIHDLRGGVHAADRDDRDEMGLVVAHPGEVRAVGGQQAPGLLDDALEDDVGLAQRRDPGGDVAQGTLRIGATGDGRL